MSSRRLVHDLRPGAPGAVVKVLVVLATVLVTLAGSVGPGFAENVKNDVVAGGNDTITLTGSSAGSTTIGYWIQPTGGCSASSTAPVSVAVNVPAGVTKSLTAPLVFTACDARQYVTLSSASVGNYQITVTVSGAAGYNVSPATFTLKVVRPNSAPVVTVGGVANGAGYEKGSVPAAVCNVSDAEDGASTSAATVSGITGSLAAYGLGGQTASCSYTDAGGLTAGAAATYSIVDTTAPVLTVPGDMFVEATGAAGAVVGFAASATDAVDPAPSVSCAPASGGTFPLGATLVSCTARDAAQVTSSSQFTVTVQDTTAPSLTLPASLTAEATGPSGARVPFTPAPSAYDAVDGALTPACTPASGALFALGVTPVNCDVADAARNRSTGGFNVTVLDTTRPVLALPGDQVLEATDPGGAAYAYSATSSDVVSGNVQVTCNIPSGTTFDMGSTTVSCSASDGVGNTASGNFTVTVRDTTAPTLTVPADIVLEATKATGRDVSFSATASDLVDGEVPVSCVPSPGGTFAVGPTTVACSATDSRGNTAAPKSFTVTITDTTPPAVTDVPGDATIEATGPNGAVQTYATPAATDVVDGIRTVACTPASGSTFPLGATTVTCGASDTRGNAASASFTVTVVDTTPPVLTVPANFDLDATGPTGAPVSWSASASDVVSGPVAATCTPASGTTFGLGVTLVTCTASDGAGNKGEKAFTVSVSDKSAPNVSVPAGQTLEATGPNGAVATWTGVSAHDLVDGRMNQVPCTPPSGSTFPLGGTKVECVATDRAGNTGRDAFAIMVVDTTPPAITVPADRVVEATGPGGAAVTYTATATDIVDGSVTPACDIASGATLALGEHTISCSAVDRAGNPATGRSFAVTVVDTTGPALTVPANQIVEATSSEGAVVTYAASAADLVDGAVAVQCSLASGATFPLGTWTVVCTASDSRGNAASRSFGVTIRDTTPPKLNTPSDITVMATSAAGATVTYQATATDDVDDGVQASCSPASGSTFAAGATTVTCNASDRYGNAATPKTFKVTVRFDFDGFFAPVDTNKVLNGMKAGSTVPMKFSISNQSGGHISDLGIVKVAAPAAVSCTTGTLYDEVTEYASGASAVKYDATANQYVYNWQSPKKPGSCYQVTILVGGAPQSAIFQLR